MGGNALKNTTTRRLTAEEYHSTAYDVYTELRKIFHTARIDPILSYQAKEDFGDLDVIVSSEDVNRETLQVVLNESFWCTEIFKNGSVWSFDYRKTFHQTTPGFQVDLIFHPRESYDYAWNYFNWNDLGNLIGRTAHAQGLAHRHDGLYYYVRDGDYRFREICLTTSYSEALTYLGYDVERFKQGFNTLEDIFEFVSNSKYFNRDIYLLHNRNAESRIRDKKRKTYMSFLKWCEERPDLPAYAYPENKQDWLDNIEDFFPAWLRELTQALADLEYQRKVKAKFNGKLVGELTGLVGKELGQFMKHLQSKFETKDSMNTWVLDSDYFRIARFITAEKEGYVNFKTSP